MCTATVFISKYFILSTSVKKMGEQPRIKYNVYFCTLHGEHGKTLPCKDVCGERSSSLLRLPASVLSSKPNQFALSATQQMFFISSTINVCLQYNFSFHFSSFQFISAQFSPAQLSSAPLRSVHSSSIQFSSLHSSPLHFNNPILSRQI